MDAVDTELGHHIAFLGRMAAHWLDQVSQHFPGESVPRGTGLDSTDEL